MAPLQYKEYGVVKSIKGCIVNLTGFENCINGQLVQFGFGTEGIIIGFDQEETQVLLIKEKSSLTSGTRAVMTLEPFNAAVGDKFIGRIVNVLAEPLDDLGPLEPDAYYPIFAQAPSVLDREILKETVETGIKIVDTMLPIGRGQRQLVLGDKMTGKTTICTDVILNQRGKDVVCIYCCIGKSKSALDRVVNLFKDKKAFEYSIVVAAMAGTSPGQQYLAPYIACSLGEYFMRKGGHVFIAFDDFTKHAWAYREISLLLSRPPGRESYPGDIFYLHSRMIERAAKLSQELGGGSITFFPIVETLEGDLTGYIPTNLVSMTDGQIYLNASLFGEGFKPAIDLGLSVSRVGTKVMWPILKKLSGSLRLDYLQYRQRLKVSTLKVGGAPSEDATSEMRSGEIVTELLTQPKDSPVDMIEQIVVFFGFARKIIFELTSEQITKLKNNIFSFAEKHYPNLLKEISEKKDLTDEIEEQLKKLYSEYIRLLHEEERNQPDLSVSE
ncbi:MAG: F0F1 ATP synthase subunit alpha [Candidatus Omnitrophota bacterium]